MTLKRIDYRNKKDVSKFIDLAGTSQNTFRYFKTRDISILKNHLLTLLVYNEDKDPVGYGHLEPEDDKIWLGICVIESALGKGIGKQIMNELISFGNDHNLCITLSVDFDNIPAITLYKKMGFKVIKNTKNIIYMEKKCQIL